MPSEFNLFLKAAQLKLVIMMVPLMTSEGSVLSANEALKVRRFGVFGVHATRASTPDSGSRITSTPVQLWVSTLV
jgi:hypothetical protein